MNTRKFTRVLVLDDKRIKFTYQKMWKSYIRGRSTYGFYFLSKHISFTGLHSAYAEISSKEWKKLGPIEIAKKIIIERDLFKEAKKNYMEYSKGMELNGHKVPARYLNWNQ